MDSSALDPATVPLEVDGESVDVRYVSGGTGPPLVFCHGIGLDAATVSWRHALDALADEFSVWALDFPGHGESGPSPRPSTTAYYEATLSAFVAEFGLQGATLAGISMGGAVALGHALDGGDPERLVLVDSYGLGADAYWRQAAGAALRVPFAEHALWGSVATRAGVRSQLSGMVGQGVPDDLVADVAGTVSPESMRTLRSWQRHEFRPDGLRTNYADRLGELSAPTLLVHGRADPLLPVSWSERASEAIANASLRVLENCGHWAPRERPAAVNAAIREFCRG